MASTGSTSSSVGSSGGRGVNTLQKATLGHYAHLHFLVFLWGFTSILGTWVTLPTTQVVFMRSWLTLVGLWVLFYLRKQIVLLPFNKMWPLLAAGALLGLHWLTFFGAARLANVSTCLAGIATASLWTSILEPFITKRKFQWLEVFLGLGVLVGLNIVFQAESDMAAGLLMAIFSALCSSLFSILNAVYIRTMDARNITLYEMAGTALFMLIFLPLFPYIYGESISDFKWLSWQEWAAMGVLSFWCTVYAYTASVELMKYFTAFGINLAINLEPVYGIIMARIVFGQSEEMSAGFYGGTLIILGCVAAHPLLLNLGKRIKASQNRRTKPEINPSEEGS